MNIRQAAGRWEVRKKTAKKICRNMQVDPKNIPDDLAPVFLYDGHQEDPHGLYLAILDVIANTHLDLDGIDRETVATCLTQLRDENLIVAKDGRPSDSGDYHDYIVTPDRERFYEWYGSKAKSDASRDLMKRVNSMAARIIRAGLG